MPRGCRTHGVTVAAVPRARHQVGHTHDFDVQVASLATQTSKSAVNELMRIAWRTVGSIIARVWDDVEKIYDQFADLRRIGIDEISYKRGHFSGVSDLCACVTRKPLFNSHHHVFWIPCGTREMSVTGRPPYGPNVWRIRLSRILRAHVLHPQLGVGG